MARLSDKHSLIAACLMLTALTLAAFLPVMGHDFLLYDDAAYVTENDNVRGGLTLQAVKWAFTAAYQGTWQPLVWLSYMADWELWHGAASGFHLTNLLLHTVNALLLLFVLLRMTQSLWRSFAVAVLFAIHPLHVESVAWIAERKDVLSTLFWMLTMLAYADYAQHRGRRRYLLVVILFALGLMAKPMLVTLPLMLLLLDWWPLRRLEITPQADSPWRTGDNRPETPWRLVREKAPLFAMAALSCAITLVVQQKGEALHPIPLALRAANAAVAYVGYIAKMLWPRDLAALYPHPLDTLPMWQVIGAAVLLAAISLLVLLASGRRPYLATGWLWYLGTLVPVIGLVQTGVHAAADRFAYVPLIGLFLIVAWGIPELLARWQARAPDGAALSRAARPVAYTVSCLVIVSLTLCTRTQVAYWRNTVTLFEHALEVTRRNTVAHCNLATALQQQGETDKAIAHYRAALRINPSDPYVYNALANLHFRQGEARKAIWCYEQVLRLDPEFEDARHNLAIARDVESGEARIQVQDGESEIAREHYNRGRAMASQGMVDEAMAEYEAAIRLAPGFAEAHNNLGVLFKNQGHMDDAISEYLKAIRAKPDLGEGHNNLAVAFHLEGRHAEAWEEVHLSERYGFAPHPGFIAALSREMPDPRSK